MARVGFVIEGGHAALPPVLGDQPAGLPADANFTTFCQTPLRLGWETELVPRDPAVLKRLDALVLLNPDVESGQPEAPAGWIEAVRAWVEAGGRLVVLSRRTHLGHPHDRAPLYLAGLDFEDVEGLGPDISLGVALTGSGRVIWALGAEAFDMEHMGHCMEYPGREERGRYETAYLLFRGLLGLPEPERRTWRPR